MFKAFTTAFYYTCFIGLVLIFCVTLWYLFSWSNNKMSGVSLYVHIHMFFGWHVWLVSLMLLPGWSVQSTDTLFFLNQYWWDSRMFYFLGFFLLVPRLCSKTCMLWNEEDLGRVLDCNVEIAKEILRIQSFWIYLFIFFKQNLYFIL